MRLLPILPRLADNKAFEENELCLESLYMSIAYYVQIGYNFPWICYYVEEGGRLVGSAAFKGAPKDNKVEIAYGTFAPFRNKGLGRRICRLLVETAIQNNPALQITARTLPQQNFSTRILQSNGFILAGDVNDPEDGTVWEWLYAPAS